jgi:hypothetical protein
MFFGRFWALVLARLSRQHETTNSTASVEAEFFFIFPTLAILCGNHEWIYIFNLFCNLFQLACLCEHPKMLVQIDKQIKVLFDILKSLFSPFCV